MKKRRILAAMTAFAVAAAAFIVPAQETGENGINIQASADESRDNTGATIANTDIVTGGGIRVKEYEEDANLTEAQHLNALQRSEKFYVMIDIPDLGHDLNGLELDITYPKDKLDVDTWYAYDTSVTEYTTKNWPLVGYYGGPLVGGMVRSLNYDYYEPGDTTSGHLKVVGEGTDNVTGYLAGTDPRPTEPRIPIFGFNSGSQYWGATDPVDGHHYNEGYDQDPAVQAWTDITKEVTYNGVPDNYVQFVAVMKVKANASLGDITIKINKHDFYTVDDTASIVHYDWWDPAVDTVTLKVANSLTGKITKYDFGTSSNNTDLTVKLKSSANVSPVTGATITTGEPDLEYTIKIGSDGTFTFKGLTPGVSYTLEVDAWCEIFNNKTSKNITITDIKIDTGVATLDIGDVEIWLYGDVDHDGDIDSLDATQILRYIVGRVTNNDITSNTSNNYKMAKVLVNDAELSARCATQILRKLVSQSSVFDDGQH